MKIKRVLSADIEEREEAFAQFAGGSEERGKILRNLGEAYDHRKAKQDERDALDNQMNELKDKIKSAGLQVEDIVGRAGQWSKLDDEALSEAIGKFLEENKIEVYTPDLIQPGDGFNGTGGSMRIKLR